MIIATIIYPNICIVYLKIILSLVCIIRKKYITFRILFDTFEFDITKELKIDNSFSNFYKFVP